MMINLNKFTDACIKYELEPNEFLFLLYLVNGDLVNMSKYFNKFPLFTKEKLEKLHTRGFIVIINPIDVNTKLTINDLIISDWFKKELTLFNPEEATQELMDCYFRTVTVEQGFSGTKTYPAINKGIHDLIPIYMSAIKSDPEAHKEVIEITKKYVKDQKHGDVGIEKYIIGKFWEVRKNNSSNKFEGDFEV